MRTSNRARIRGMRITAALCLCVLVSASCGGNSDNTSGGPSKAEFVTQANAICKRHADPVRAAAAKLLAGGKLPSPKKFKKLAMNTIIPEVSAQVHELGSLTAPASLSKAFRKWLSDSESVRQQMMQDPTVITNAANFQTINREADSLGLSSDCHVGPS